MTATGTGAGDLRERIAAEDRDAASGVTVTVDHETWDRIKTDYCAAIGLAAEKDHYLRNPGGTWTQPDIDRAQHLAEWRWQQLAAIAEAGLAPAGGTLTAEERESAMALIDYCEADCKIGTLQGRAGEWAWRELREHQITKARVHAKMDKHIATLKAIVARSV